MVESPALVLEAVESDASVVVASALPDSPEVPPVVSVSDPVPVPLPSTHTLLMHCRPSKQSPVLLQGHASVPAWHSASKPLRHPVTTPNAVERTSPAPRARRCVCTHGA